MTCKPLPTSELLDIRSVLERSLQREQQKIADRAGNVMAEHHAEQLAEAIRELNVELNGRVADAMGHNV